MNRLYGYLCLNQDNGEVRVQQQVVADFIKRMGWSLNGMDWIEQDCSNRSGRGRLRAAELIQGLGAGDTLVAADLGRLGRSVSDVVSFVSTVVRHGVRLVCVRQELDFWSGNGTSGQVLIQAYAQLADLEREIVSARTADGLRKAVELHGKKLGRPKGSLGKSKLDGHEEGISRMVIKGMSISAIARLYGVSRPALVNFIKTRLSPGVQPEH